MDTTTKGSDKVRELAERIADWAGCSIQANGAEHIIRDALQPLLAASTDVLCELSDRSTGKAALQAELVKWRKP